MLGGRWDMLGPHFGGNQTIQIYGHVIAISHIIMHCFDPKLDGHQQQQHINLVFCLFVLCFFFFIVIIMLTIIIIIIIVIIIIMVDQPEM